MALVSPVGRLMSAMRAPLMAAAMFVFGSSVFSPRPALAIEPVQRIVSPGGIEALLIESHEVGLISMRVSFRGWGRARPRGQARCGLLHRLHVQ